MDKSNRVFIAPIEEDYATRMQEGLQYIGVLNQIDGNTRIAIKPNLTFPTFRAGVMTTPAAVEGLVKVLREKTSHISIVESDSGGYNPFSISEVFEKTGLVEFGKRYGIRLVNLTGAPSRDIPVKTTFRELRIPLPKLLLDETDLFITMPVPKVHANTLVSLSMKNQWGVIQQPSMRLKLHPFFDEVIYAVNKALPRPISVMDGTFGLTRNGPMRGDALMLGWLLVSNNLFTADYCGTQLMDMPWERVSHLRYAFKRECLERVKQFDLNTSLEPFKSREFFLQREWTDYPGWVAFKSRFAAYIGYESKLASPLHWALYLWRERFY